MLVDEVMQLKYVAILVLKYVAFFHALVSCAKHDSPWLQASGLCLCCLLVSTFSTAVNVILASDESGGCRQTSGKTPT